MSRRREEENTEGQDTQMRVKYNRLLHGSNRTTTAEPLTTAFLKKYIRYAKSRYGCPPPPPPLPLYTPLSSCIIAAHKHIWGPQLLSPAPDSSRWHLVALHCSRIMSADVKNHAACNPERLIRITTQFH